MSEQNQSESISDQKTSADGNTGTPPQQEETPKVQFTAEQQAEINKMIGNARREGKQSAEAEATAAKAAAEAEAERDRQVKAGEFEAVRASLESERDTAASERDAVKSQLEALTTAIKPGVEAEWNELPEEVVELYAGEDDDVLAKQAHIARHRKLIDRLTEQASERKVAAGFGRTPNQNQNLSRLDQDKANAKRSGKYSI